LAFNDVKVEQIKATIGPTLTLYEFTPAPGTRVAKMRGLAADLGLYLAAHIRVVGPIPGKGTMGVEIPHGKIDPVAMRALLATGNSRPLRWNCRWLWVKRWTILSIWWI